MKKKDQFDTKKIVNKYSSSFFFGLIFGLVLGIMFSIIDSLIFLAAEEWMTEFLDRSIHNRNVIGLLEGTISSSIAFLIASFIEKKLYSKKINIIKHPFIDFLGIILGGLIVVCFYYLFSLLKNRN